MLKKTISLCILSFTLLFTSCTASNQKKFEMYLLYNKDKNEVSQRIDVVPVAKTVYVMLQSDKAFKNTNVNVNITRIDNNTRTIIGGFGTVVNENKNRAVIPIKINQSGTYELLFFTKTPEEPILTGNIVAE